MLEIIKNLLFPIKINHITNNNSLKNLCQEIEKFKICAIDTEFMRNKTYFPILCLVQINVNNKLYIIDPIAYKLNLLPFYKILSNKKIIKIIHSARHDLEVLFFEKNNRNYQNIIDTQIMANFCNLGYNVGYKLLSKKICSKKLCDKSQRSNWKKRPLTNQQIKYAALDVKYLIKIYHKLDKKLQKLGRKSWFNWEMKDFINKCKIHNPSAPEILIKRFNLTKKNQNYINNITSLAIIRDDICKKINLPKNFVIHDDVMEKIVKDEPKSILDLNKHKSLNKKITNEEKEKIIEIFINKNEEEKNKTKINKFNKKQTEIYNKAKNLLECTAKQYSIDKSFILNDKNLKKIIIKDIKITEILKNWRYDIIGKKLNDII